MKRSKVNVSLLGRTVGWPLAGCVLATALSACGGGASTDPTAAMGDLPVAYVKRVNTFRMDPLTGAPGSSLGNPGGDLMIREASSPSAPEHNITLPFTQGVGDAADPEVSYDGKKIVFAMRCPSTNTAQFNGAPACTNHWNIWEYDMSAGGISAGTFRRITGSTTFDDVAPVYLPGGNGFVFSSNRQAGELATQFVDRTQSPAVTHSYQALDEYERETVFNLHTMDVNGGNIQQISFNQSHDRNPVVRPDGTIMFARWEHVADRNRFTIFTVNPDGTNMFVLYGAHADGNSFLHPRDMDPSGPYAGMISSDLMPLDRTQSGGALMLIDAKNYSDQNTPINSSVPATGGQTQLTSQALNIGTGPSLYGRVTTPYPLWDGSNRFLVSFAPCQVSNAGVVVSCSTLSATQLAALANPNRLLTDVAKDPIQDNVPPSYAVYMFDPANQTWLLVAAPPPGYMYTDPMPLQARAEPKIVTRTTADPTLAAQGLATLTVASVYDTDLLDNMGLSRLAAADLPAGCTTPITGATSAALAMIPQTAPLDSQDTRATVADINRIKDPAQAPYNCTPLRFIRVIRAIAPPAGSTGERQAIGDTNFEQNQILGYAVVEPDGSFQVNVPANTPIAFSVLDQNGRAFQVHTNWIQARPGEIRSCDGCHSPRRGSPINSGTIINTVPAAWLPAMKAAHQTGYTMAQTHGNFVAAGNSAITTANNPVYSLMPDLSFTDVWADPTHGGLPRPKIQVDYSGLSTRAPLDGVINYPDHIQPIWSAARAVNGADATCTKCHNAADAQLNLSATSAGTGRVQSYEALMVGAPLLDSSGNPVLVVQDGVQVVQTGPALVYSTASEQPAVGLARQSRLVEILSGQPLLASLSARTAFPAPPATAPDHSKMLNASEMRLVVEWIDLGGKYYNDPFNSASGATVTAVNALDQTVFVNQVYPILMSSCAANCHLARGSGSAVPPGASFLENKFVLTGNPGTAGSPGGDYNNTLTMISDTCNPADPSNYLLSKPSTIPHPAGAIGQTAAILPVGSPNYLIISNWIRSGCP